MVSQIEEQTQGTAMAAGEPGTGGSGLRPAPSASAQGRRDRSATPRTTRPEAELRRDGDERTARTSPWSLRSCLELGPLPGAVPCARLHARHVLWEWNLSELGEPAELVVSELVTNAIRAAQAVGGDRPVRFWLLADRARVAICVWDSCPDPPRPGQAGDSDENGRGLQLVEAMSASWDWYPHDGGKVIQAILEAGQRRT